MNQETNLPEENDAFADWGSLYLATDWGDGSEARWPPFTIAPNTRKWYCTIAPYYTKPYNKMEFTTQAQIACWLQSKSPCTVVTQIYTFPFFRTVPARRLQSKYDTSTKSNYWTEKPWRGTTNFQQHHSTIRNGRWIWFFSLYIASRNLYILLVTCNQYVLITSHQGGKPLDRGKPPSLLRRPCFYLTTFVKALPVIFISRFASRIYYW